METKSTYEFQRHLPAPLYRQLQQNHYLLADRVRSPKGRYDVHSVHSQETPDSPGQVRASREIGSHLQTPKPPHLSQFTKIPDVLLDNYLAVLSGAEFKVIMYIARRTYGFQKMGDNISLAQISSGITRRDGTALDHGTGLSKQGVCNALKILEGKDLVRRTQRSAPKHGNLPTYYELTLPAHQLIPPVHSVDKPNSVDKPSPSDLARPVTPSLQEPVQSVDSQHTVSQETFKQKIATAIEQSSPCDSESGRHPSAFAAVVAHKEDAVSTSQDLALIDSLVEAGLNKLDAETFVKTKPDEARRQLQYLQYKTGLKNPGGYLKRAIEGDFSLPKEFVSAEEERVKRTQMQEAIDRRNEAKAIELAKREAQSSRVDQQIRNLEHESPDRYKEFLRYVETQRKKAEERWAQIGNTPRILERNLRFFDSEENLRTLFAAWQDASSGSF